MGEMDNGLRQAASNDMTIYPFRLVNLNIASFDSVPFSGEKSITAVRNGFLKVLLKLWHHATELFIQ